MKESMDILICQKKKEKCAVHTMSQFAILLCLSGLPFGQLPYLEWGDLKIAQSFAIFRYVAKKVGLAGKDAEEDAKIDMIADHISDHMEGEDRNTCSCMFPLYAFNVHLCAGFGPFFELKDEAAKKEIAEKTLKTKIPFFLAKSEELLKKAGGKYFVGNRVSDFCYIN